MAQAKLSYVNLVDGSSSLVTSSEAAGAFPPTNLQDTRPLKRWRTTSLTAWGQCDFGANVSVDVVVLLFSRDVTLPSGTIQHTFDVDGGTPGAGATLDSGVISLGLTEGYAYHVYQLSSTQSIRYWRWTYAATGVTFIDTGRAWAGALWNPARDIGLGYLDTWTDGSVKEEATRSGSVFVEEQDKRRLAEFGFTSLTAAERLTVREIERTIGTSKQVLFLIDPDTTTTETVLGRLKQTNGVRNRDRTTSLFETAYTVKEF